MKAQHTLPPHGALPLWRYCLLEGRTAAQLSGLLGGAGLAVSFWFWQLAPVPGHDPVGMADALIFGITFCTLAALTLVFIPLALIGWRRLCPGEWLLLVLGLAYLAVFALNLP